MKVTNLYGITGKNGDLIIPHFILRGLGIGCGMRVELIHISEAQRKDDEISAETLDFSQIDTEEWIKSQYISNQELEDEFSAEKHIQNR